MSTKLGRGTANARINASVRRFSEALLVEELRFLGEVAGAFRVGQADGMGSLTSALRRSKGVDGLKNDGTLVPKLADSVSVATAQARLGAEQLATNGAALALESVSNELKLVERTVAAKYAGVVDSGTAAAAAGVSGIVDSGMGLYDQAIATVESRFLDQATTQLSLAWSREETEDQLKARLFSPTPIKMHGNGGKGVFWQAADYVNSAGRAMVVGVANAVREEAMRQVNEAYAAVRNA